MRVVLGEAAHTHQPVEHPTALMPVNDAQLRHAQRQVTVAAELRLVDQDAAGTVHRLDGKGLLVDLGEVHVLLVVVPVPGLNPQRTVQDQRRADLHVAALQVLPTPEVGERIQDGHPLGVEEREARPLVVEAKKVQLAPQLAVIAQLRLLQALQVLFQLVRRGEGRAVDAGQHLVLLAAAPVGPRDGEQLEIAVPGRVRGVGAPAQIGPHDAAVAGAVVVHGQPAGADLDRGALGARSLGGDELELVGLVGQLLTPLVLGDVAAHEALPLLDDPLHALLDLAQHLGGDGVDGAEVVVEAVGDEGADAEVDVREHLLDGLRHDVGGAVAQDVEAVLAGQGDGLDDGARRDLALQIPGLAVDAHRDDTVLLDGVLQEERPRAARLNGAGRAVEGDLNHGLV